MACSFAPIHDPKGSVECVACTAIPSPSAEVLADRAIELREIERFLHDTVAQDLAALSCTLAQIEAMSRGLEVHADAAAAIDLTDRCCRDVRIMSSMLFAPLTAGRTVERAMEQIARHLREDSGLEVMLDVDPVSDLLPDGARTLLLTAFQQCCARAARLTPRPELKVRLRERRRGIVLELESDAALRSGWSAIRERARALGGEFDIGRGASDGKATVRVRLVLPISGEG